MTEAAVLSARRKTQRLRQLFKLCNSCATYIEHRELWLVVVHPGQAEPLLLAEAEDVLPLDLLVPAGKSLVDLGRFCTQLRFLLAKLFDLLVVTV